MKTQQNVKILYFILSLPLAFLFCSFVKKKKKSFSLVFLLLKSNVKIWKKFHVQSLSNWKNSSSSWGVVVGEWMVNGKIIYTWKIHTLHSYKYFVQVPEIENILRFWGLMPFGQMDKRATQKHTFGSHWYTWQYRLGEWQMPWHWLKLSACFENNLRN
jgi:hypothetical protein